MGAGPHNEPLASPGNSFPGRKRRVAELFAELFGRSFLAFPHFAAVDHHIMRVALSLDLDLAEFDQPRFHICIFRWLDLQGNNAVIRVHDESGAAIETHEHAGDTGLALPDRRFRLSAVFGLCLDDVRIWARAVAVVRPHPVIIERICSQPGNVLIGDIADIPILEPRHVTGKGTARGDVQPVTGRIAYAAPVRSEAAGSLVSCL